MRGTIADSLTNGLRGRPLDATTARGALANNTTLTGLARATAQHMIDGGLRTWPALLRDVAGYSLRSAVMFGGAGWIIQEGLTDLTLANHNIDYKWNGHHLNAALIGAALGGGPLAFGARLPEMVILGGVGGAAGFHGNQLYEYSQLTDEQRQQLAEQQHEQQQNPQRAGGAPNVWEAIGQGAVGGVWERYLGQAGLSEARANWGDLAHALNLTNPTPEATIPTIPTTTDSKDLKSLIRNHTGLVLVRHEFKEETASESNAEPGTPSGSTEQTQNGSAGSQNTPAGDVHFFYSLYMHLAPPEGTDYTENVTWYNELVKRRYGALIPFPSQGRSCNDTMVWLKEEFSESKKTLIVFGRDPVEPQAQNARWFYKPPMAAYDKILDELEAGKLITFTEPYLSVKAGDLLGYIQTPTDLLPASEIHFTVPFSSGEHTATDDTNSKPLTGTPGEGFLHWEIFAPVLDGGTNGIEKLIELFIASSSSSDSGSSSAPEFTNADFPTIAEDTGKVNNYWEVEEITSTLANALPDGERDKFTSMFSRTDNNKKFNYRSKMLSLYNDPALFASDCTPSPEISVIEPGDKNVAIFAMDLKLDCSALPQPSQNGMQGSNEYVLLCKFSRSRPGATAGSITTENLPGKWKVTLSSCGEEPLSLIMPVPVNAENLIIETSPESTGITVADRGSITINLQKMKDIITHRFRNVKLRHHNEWTKTAMDQLVTILGDSGVKHPGLSKLDALAWWEESTLLGKILDTAANVPPATVELMLTRYLAGSIRDKVSNPLFTGNGTVKLPLSGQIDNLHPVTAIWMINYLAGKSKIKIVEDQSKRLFDPQARTGVYTWILEPENKLPVVGDSATILVIDDDYDYSTVDEKVQIWLKSGNNKLNLGKHNWVTGGDYGLTLPMTFWGEWNCIIGNEQSPFVSMGENSTKVTLPVPRLATSVERKKKDFILQFPSEKVCWVIPLEGNGTAPVMLDGVIALMVKTGPSTWEENGYLPVTAVNSSLPDLPVDSNSAFDIIDGLICRFSSAELVRIIKKDSGSHVVAGDISYDFLKGLRSSLVVQQKLISTLETLKSKTKFSIVSINSRGTTALICANYTVKNGESKNEKIHAENIKLFDQTINCNFTDAVADTFDVDNICYGILLTIIEPDETGCAISKAKQSTSCLLSTTVNGRTTYKTYKISFGELSQAMAMLVSIRLIHVVDALKKENVPFKLVSLTSDGHGFVCSSKNENILKILAKQKDIYQAKKISSQKYEFTVTPGLPNTLQLMFDPSQLLNNAMATVSSGTEISYCYRFIAVNGLRYYDAYKSYFDDVIDNDPLIQNSEQFPSAAERIVYTSGKIVTSSVARIEDLQIVESSAGFLKLSAKTAGDDALWLKLNVKCELVIDRTPPQAIVVSKSGSTICGSFSFGKIADKSFTIRIFTVCKNGAVTPFIPERTFGPYTYIPQIKNVKASQNKNILTVTADFFGIPADKDFTIKVFGRSLENVSGDLIHEIKTIECKRIAGQLVNFVGCNAEGKSVTSITFRTLREKNVVCEKIILERRVLKDKNNKMKDNKIFGVNVAQVEALVKGE
jgi:hypothetical protein